MFRAMAAEVRWVLISTLSFQKFWGLYFVSQALDLLFRCGFLRVAWVGLCIGVLNSVFQLWRVGVWPLSLYLTSRYEFVLWGGWISICSVPVNCAEGSHLCRVWSRISVVVTKIIRGADPVLPITSRKKSRKLHRNLLVWCMRGWVKNSENVTKFRVFSGWPILSFEHWYCEYNRSSETSRPYYSLG